MASFSRPNSFPSFPPNVPILDVETLSLGSLLTNDGRERKKLFDICTTTGLFLLNLEDREATTQLVRDVDVLFQLSVDLFALDDEIKEQYSMLSPIGLGYKGIGVGRIDAKGTPDRCEFWGMGKDDVLGHIPRFPAPEMVTQRRELYAAFAKQCNHLCMLIIARLETELGVPSGTLLSRHRIDEQSSDLIHHIRNPPQPEGDRQASLLPHTDFGSVTILFNVLGSLQVLPPDQVMVEENWRWVKPEPNCAIINLGDAMVKLTNGLFKSPMHRVTYPPGEQAQLTRYSLGYFARPEDGCKMKTVEGSAMVPVVDGAEGEGEVTAGEWVRTKTRAALQQKEEGRVLYPAWATRGLK